MKNDQKKLKAGVLRPHLVAKVWGGLKLGQYKKFDGKSSKDPLGETWEVSCHPSGTSLLYSEPLTDLVLPKQLPYLVKFIDTNQHLSIQVHPDNEYAKKHEKQAGKNECWLILDAEKGAGVYLGLKKKMNKKKLQESIEANQDISKLMNFYPVHKGDFYYVPAGSIHAIGEGVTLLEVQQSSGVTYRVWDWNRLDSLGQKRELHIKKALDVINFEEEFNEKKFFKFKKGLLKKLNDSDIIEHDDFCVKIMVCRGNKIELENNSKRHWSVINLGQTLKLKGGGQEYQLLPYESFFIPIGDDVSIENDRGQFVLVK